MYKLEEQTLIGVLMSGLLPGRQLVVHDKPPNALQRR